VLNLRQISTTATGPAAEKTKSAARSIGRKIENVAGLTTIIPARSFPQPGTLPGKPSNRRQELS
jgi:hypothetical protein